MFLYAYSVTKEAFSSYVMLFFGQLLHRVFIVIDQGHDLTAAMFFFTERLLAQAIFLEEDFTDFRQQETVLADDSRFPGNPDNPQDLAAHDDGIIDALADTLFRAIFLDGLNLSRPGGDMAGLVVGANRPLSVLAMIRP